MFGGFGWFCRFFWWFCRVLGGLPGFWWLAWFLGGFGGFLVGFPGFVVVAGIPEYLVGLGLFFGWVLSLGAFACDLTRRVDII